MAADKSTFNLFSAEWDAAKVIFIIITLLLEFSGWLCGFADPQTLVARHGSDFH